MLATLEEKNDSSAEEQKELNPKERRTAYRKAGVGGGQTGTRSE